MDPGEDILSAIRALDPRVTYSPSTRSSLNAGDSDGAEDEEFYDVILDNASLSGRPLEEVLESSLTSLASGDSDPEGFASQSQVKEYAAYMATSALGKDIDYGSSGIFGSRSSKTVAETFTREQTERIVKKAKDLGVGVTPYLLGVLQCCYRGSDKDGGKGGDGWSKVVVSMDLERFGPGGAGRDSLSCAAGR